MHATIEAVAIDRCGGAVGYLAAATGPIGCRSRHAAQIDAPSGWNRGAIAGSLGAAGVESREVSRRDYAEIRSVVSSRSLVSAWIRVPGYVDQYSAARPLPPE